MGLIAITRAVSSTLADCELTHRPRDPIDVTKAIAEHAVYEQALGALGATVVHAPPEPAHPDAVFVEDAAIVLDEIAIITRPGAPARRGETESLARVLSQYRPLLRIGPPGTLDGGDVLRVGRTLYVGVSSRTNGAAVAQLADRVRRWDYRVTAVPVTGCLHLKSAVTQVAERLLLINPGQVPAEYFAGFDLLTVDPREPDAANALMIDSAVVYPAHYPATAERLSNAGVKAVLVPCAEIAKAEGGVTCCSVIFHS